MARKTAAYIIVLGALVAPALAGCRFETSTNTGGEQPPPPPPPPAEPAPAPEEPKAEAEPVQPKTTATVSDGKVSIPGNIVFDTGKATLKEAESKEVLDQLKVFLEENPRVTKLRIEGHTDDQGEDALNMDLSARRANAVKKWLVDNGVAADRLLSVGFGESKPLADNRTEEGRAQNRRTEFHIAELDGKRYLGRDPTGGGKVIAE